jgi:thiamine-phosphate pyrophosphorylase
LWAKYRVTPRKIIAPAAFPSQSVYGLKERGFKGDRENGRSDRIRTCDIQFPKLALYQAELRSDLRGLFKPIAPPPQSRNARRLVAWPSGWHAAPRLAAMKPLDQCLLYGFVDSAYLNGRDPVELCRQLCDGGADLVQLRAKGWPILDIARLAKRLSPITAGAGVRLVINDHPEIAAEVGASTAHLGQEDFFDAGYNDVDKVKPDGSTLELGLSTHAPEQARRACEAKADYIAIGPVFATPTKPGRPPVTLDYVRWAAKNIDRPWFAIGGIDLENLDEVLAAGARRVCVVSAILRAPDVAGACRQFKERLLSAAR